jgi:aerobic-type carbon monoxide dehydrogenase small subunit (CoxS/CutS family)
MRPVEQPSEEIEVELTVNGERVAERVSARMLLTDFLRDRLALTGTHVGCEHGVCGACTVLIDGRASRSCITLCAQVDGCEITTVEYGGDRRLDALRDEFARHHALQCGFCTPGILLTIAAADEAEFPGDDGIREMLAGTLCRCTGYHNIVQAVRAFWQRDEAGGGALQAIAERLRDACAADRVTIRADRPPEFFPIVAEARGEGVPSLVGAPSVDLARAATFVAVHDRREVVIQHDCLTDPPQTPPEVIAVYGVRAQMLAPAEAAGRVVATISVHQLSPRRWTHADRDALTAAAARAAFELEPAQL